MIRQMAFGICLLCAIAGMIRIFWPDNHFKPVINTVLLLYILTSAFQTGASADWAAIADGFSTFSMPPSSSADLTAYQTELGREVSVRALESVFEQKGIAAGFGWADGVLRIELPDAADLSDAQDLLAQNSGTLPYVLEVKEGD